jgi:hypothetical protein
VKRLLATAVLVAAGVALLLAPATALAPDAHGWWWFAQPPGSPLSVPTPPFVPDEGLYVASNPTGAEAIAALRFTAEGAGGTLTLRFAGEVRGEPVLGLCVVTEPWEPAHGGALADAPAFDCEAGAAAGTLADDGASVMFPVALLVRDDALDVVVVPGQDASGSNPTFQAAFEPPDDSTLAPPSAGADDPGVPTAVPGEPSPTAGAAPPPPPPFAPAAVDPSRPPAAIPPPPPVDIDAADGGPAPQSVQVPGIPTTSGAGGDSSPANRTRVLGFVVLAAAAVAYHRLSTTPDREPQALVQFGRHTAAAADGGAPVAEAAG